MGKKSWQGLFQKEWTLMKWGIFVYVLLNIFVVFVGPTLISKVFDIPQGFFDNTLVLVGAWLVFGMFIGCGMLFTSLGKEMKQRDVWLHSPASMLQLVGAKAIFSAIVTACLLLLSGILLGVSFFFSDAVGTISFSDGVLVLLSVIIAIFLISLCAMAIGFFFWSIYQVLYSRIGGFSIVVTFALFLVGRYLWEKPRLAGLFQAIKEIGPIKITDATFYNEYNSYFFTGIVPEGVITSIGSLLFYGILMAVLFVAGATLFEKKVRL